MPTCQKIFSLGLQVPCQKVEWVQRILDPYGLSISFSIFLLTSPPEYELDRGATVKKR